MKTTTTTSTIIALGSLMAVGCIGYRQLGVLTDTDSDGMSGTGAGSEDSGNSGASSTTAGATSATGSGSDTGAGVLPSDSVDILFVVDNSGSMGEEQGMLATGILDMTEVFMQNGTSFRVGITTTDNGNPICQGTGPEGGQLVMSSCHSRLPEFIFVGAAGEINAQEEGCLDVCALEEIDLAPTTTSVDPVPKPRPWLEWNGPEDNNFPGLHPAHILSCALPQGIRGCGFEQPLESMHKSLLRGWTDVGDAAHGFLRDDANLVVIFVTDEVDCSHNSEFDTAFLPNGNRVFWSNPDEGQPTSAVCWNAGVECSGAGDPYTECHSQGYDVDGNLAASPDTAVLHPLDRYTSILQDVQAGKTAGRVHLFGIVGVDDSGSATYQDSVGDPVFQEDFGIGSGCGSPIGTAVPPVRLRELIETIDGTAANNMTSICGSDYGPALTNLAQRIVDNTL